MPNGQAPDSRPSHRSPQFQRRHLRAARLRLILHPEKLQHGVGEEEPPACRPLTGVAVGRPFHEPARHEVVRLRRARGGEEEEVVEEEVAQAIFSIASCTDRGSSTRTK